MEVDTNSSSIKDKLISRVKIKNLFGLYSYDLPESEIMTDAAILYGDNGVGKSTILKLVFHLLSVANDRGHRNALYKSDFESLEVTLSSGVVVAAEFKIKDGDKILSLSVSSGGNKLVIWDFIPDQRRSITIDGERVFFANNENVRVMLKQKKSGTREKASSIPSGNIAFLDVLKTVVPTIFMLNADRRLDSDTVSDPSDEVELRRLMRIEEMKNLNELVIRSREIALTQALSSAGRWVSMQAVLGANQGSTNVHSVYVDVLHHLITSSGKSEVKTTSKEILISKVESIEVTTAELSKYELTTPLSTSDFIHALSITDGKQSSLAAELLTPYITSLERRLEALEPIYKIVDKFVNIVNGFLNDKSIGYRLSQGFYIESKRAQTLSASQLSSGEQQLLLLFCYVLTAREKPSVFIIDEPEISLNIKWQRQLIQSLLDITEGANIQFIFASHSMELLTQHKNKVVKLVNKND